MSKEDKQYIKDVKRMVASDDGKFNSVLRVTENRTPTINLWVYLVVVI